MTCQKVTLSILNPFFFFLNGICPTLRCVIEHFWEERTDKIFLEISELMIIIYWK